MYVGWQRSSLQPTPTSPRMETPQRSLLQAVARMSTLGVDGSSTKSRTDGAAW